MNVSTLKMRKVNFAKISIEKNDLSNLIELIDKNAVLYNPMDNRFTVYALKFMLISELRKNRTFPNVK